MKKKLYDVVKFNPKTGKVVTVYKGKKLGEARHTARILGMFLFPLTAKVYPSGQYKKGDKISDIHTSQ